MARDSEVWKVIIDDCECPYFIVGRCNYNKKNGISDKLTSCDIKSCPIKVVD